MPETLALNFDLPSYFYLLREVCGVSSQKEREVCGVEQWKNTRGFASNQDAKCRRKKFDAFSATMAL